MIGSLLQTQDNVLVQASDQTPTFSNMKCEGDYRYIFQGVCTNERYTVYWSFTTDLVETDRLGRVQRNVAIANHYGDLCFSEGKLCGAVNLDRSNDPNGNADSWVYVYKAATLKLLAKYETHEVFHRTGGIGARGRPLLYRRRPRVSTVRASFW